MCLILLNWWLLCVLVATSIVIIYGRILFSLIAWLFGNSARSIKLHLRLGPGVRRGQQILCIYYLVIIRRFSSNRSHDLLSLRCDRFRGKTDATLANSCVDAIWHERWMRFWDCHAVGLEQCWLVKSFWSTSWHLILMLILLFQLKKFMLLLDLLQEGSLFTLDAELHTLHLQLLLEQ